MEMLLDTPVCSAWDWDERADYLVDKSDDVMIDVLEIECVQLPYAVGFARTIEDVHYVIENILGDPADWKYLTDLKITIRQTQITDREWNALEPFEEIL